MSEQLKIETMHRLLKLTDDTKQSLLNLLTKLPPDTILGPKAKEGAWRRISGEIFKLTNPKFFYNNDFHFRIEELLKVHARLEDIFSGLEHVCGNSDACRQNAAAYLANLKTLHDMYVSSNPSFETAGKMCTEINVWRVQTEGTADACVENARYLYRHFTKDLEAFYNKITVPISAETLPPEVCEAPEVIEVPEVCEVPGECEVPEECENPHLNDIILPQVPKEVYELFDDIKQGALNGGTHGFIRGITNVMANNGSPITAKIYYYTHMFLFDLLRLQTEKGEDTTFTANCLEALTNTGILIGLDNLNLQDDLRNLANHSHRYVAPIINTASDIVHAGLFAYNACAKGVTYMLVSSGIGYFTEKGTQKIAQQVIDKIRLQR